MKCLETSDCTAWLELRQTYSLGTVIPDGPTIQPEHGFLALCDFSQGTIWIPSCVNDGAPLMLTTKRPGYSLAESILPKYIEFSQIWRDELTS